ncbi:hypothetical protein [Rossellomorea marisflavi]|uniref:hypothetical protein n=1 Tax=Rossellomorea marisflavi TaxID=189381 RepID=UPI003FA03FC1
MEKKQSIEPSLKANIQDSLHFLLEINIKVQEFKNGEIDEKEFSQYIEKRSTQYGYIADHKHTMKLIKSVNSLND